jgi:Protein of unknown function (DUF2844)
MTMPGDSRFKRAVLPALFTVALMPHLACAALGEPEATAAADAQQLKGTIKSTETTNYRLHEIQLPSGTVLREYAVVGGNVFAVAWSGSSKPDLRQALGQYFDVYVSAAKVKRTGRHPVSIEQNGLVVQSGGHMRAFTGRAYLAKAIPAGSKLEEIR